jgi:hypothetical protein
MRCGVILTNICRPAVFLAVLVACGPNNGADDMQTLTDGTSTTTVITAADSADSTSSAEQPTDSSESSSGGVEFGCPGARWHEGDLLVNDASNLEELRDIGGVRGSLSVRATTSLVDLEFLSCLEIVEGTVTIRDNNSLMDLHGLEQLQAINGDSFGKIWDLGIINNDALPRIDSLDSLEDVELLVIGENGSLVEIDMAAVRQVGLLLLGGYCVIDEPPVANQPLAGVGNYPVLERVQSFALYGQYEMVSLESLIQLAERGVTFDEAHFLYNSNLPQSEIEAFAAVASISPEACSNMDDLEPCPRCPAGQ